MSSNPTVTRIGLRRCDGPTRGLARLVYKIIKERGVPVTADYIVASLDADKNSQISWDSKKLELSLKNSVYQGYLVEVNPGVYRAASEVEYRARQNWLGTNTVTGGLEAQRKRYTPKKSKAKRKAPRKRTATPPPTYIESNTPMVSALIAGALVVGVLAGFVTAVLTLGIA